MRPAPLFLIAMMFLSLLTLQMSGLHLHAGADSESAALHGTHVHDADPGGHGHGHGHDAETDVSSFEQGTGWFKLMPFLVILIFALLIIIRISRTVWPPGVERLSIRHRSRWRPPLRAPPQLSL